VFRPVAALAILLIPLIPVHHMAIPVVPVVVFARRACLYVSAEFVVCCREERPREIGSTGRRVGHC
jgi:hypothetical protein